MDRVSISKTKSMPKQEFITTLLQYMTDGWSYELCMSKIGVKSSIMRQYLIQKHPEIAFLKKIYYENRKSSHTHGGTSIYRKAMAEYDSQR